ncbi:peptidoglycan DD-metalloendopeptidase family protein [Candidiatus Paracoxiella cheracis]|uniref:peptidoglycan DD-metalloendopeptidase family protein n=1 Tax=Candidiatus Paracoxiella cheracis TaxID=3405120 RepID=UPI003BF544F9
MKRFNVKLRCRFFFFIIFIGLLTACSSGSNYAPVVNAWTQPSADSGLYRVKKGDTLYSIAWAFGLDYRALATANHLKPPYEIHAGQTLRMTIIPREQEQKSTIVTRKKAQPVSKSKKSTKERIYVAQWPAKPVTHWVWPATGRIIDRFSASLAGNNGINIAGRYGEPVRAASNGIVVYSGAGVRGYGNLIIVKHNNSYLSAYAFNKRLMVKEGTRVRAGQEIAEMGRDNSGKVMLHFEIRRNGKPVNPLKYLS